MSAHIENIQGAIDFAQKELEISGKGSDYLRVVINDKGFSLQHVISLGDEFKSLLMIDKDDLKKNSISDHIINYAKRQSKKQPSCSLFMPTKDGGKPHEIEAIVYQIENQGKRTNVVRFRNHHVGDITMEKIERLPSSFNELGIESFQIKCSTFSSTWIEELKTWMEHWESYVNRVNNGEL